MAMRVDCPKLRPVEVIPTEHDGQRMFHVHDSTRLTSGVMTVSAAVMVILSLMDGRHGLEDIQRIFAEKVGQNLPPEQLNDLIEQLDTAHFLDNPSFVAYYQSKVEEYRSASARISTDVSGLVVDEDELKPTIDQMLAGCEISLTGAKTRKLAGFIVPHLDFTRGKACYGDAYGTLAVCPPAKRFVILGTNHFGQAASVVATGKDFQTPLGTTPTDRDFLEDLQQRCDSNLFEHEFDHQREHSVETQVLILQHMFGAENFQIVPILCPDVCGPTGTEPHDGNGVDLRVFSQALGELIAADDTPTIIIASADLSHVGGQFGDANDLDKPFLAEVQRSDREVLEVILAGQAEAFVDTLKRRDNHTRICSAGCIYTLMSALPETRPELLRYLQAADRDSGTGVTCAAVAFWQNK